MSGRTRKADGNAKLKDQQGWAARKPERRKQQKSSNKGLDTLIVLKSSQPYHFFSSSIRSLFHRPHLETGIAQELVKRKIKAKTTNKAAGVISTNEQS
jgi:hypothetical protein